MWQFCTQCGALAHDGQPMSHGYSGHGPSKDNPADAAIPNCGPLPRGFWGIGTPRSHTHMGPLAMPLTPFPDTETLHRFAFWIHGDSIAHPGEGSLGCVCLPHPARLAIASSNDTTLYAGPTACQPATIPPLPDGPPT